MAIDAMVGFVELYEDGSGVLHLAQPRPGAIEGQPRLRFYSAPCEVTALNGLPIWGSSTVIMLGLRKIADRSDYTRISFVKREDFLEAVRLWHESARQEDA